jgi:conjugal transfer pilus assembly protein TraF
MLDKAEKFAEVSQRVVMADSLLDENTRRPIATFGGTAKDEMSTKGTEKAAKKLAQLAGLWFFYESNCEFCVKQAGVLKGLMNAYGFKVLAIARDGLPLPDGSFSNFTVDRGQSKKLGVEMTPALFLVKPGEQGGAIQLGQGLLAGDEIVKRTIVLAHQYAWLNEEEYEDTLKVSPIQVETEMIQNVRDNLMGNPSELIRTIRDNLKKQL